MPSLTNLFGLLGSKESRIRCSSSVENPKPRKWNAGLFLIPSLLLRVLQRNRIGHIRTYRRRVVSRNWLTLFWRLASPDSAGGPARWRPWRSQCRSLPVAVRYRMPSCPGVSPLLLQPFTRSDEAQTREDSNPLSSESTD